METIQKVIEGQDSGVNNDVNTKEVQPRIVAVLTGNVVAVGNEFTNSRGNVQRAVVIETGSIDVAKAFEKYAPATSVNGNQVTIFVSSTVAANAHIDGKATVSIDQRLKDVTGYAIGKGATRTWKTHEQDGFGIHGLPMFEKSLSQKAIDTNLQKVNAYTVDSTTVAKFARLAEAGISVSLIL